MQTSEKGCISSSMVLLPRVGALRMICSWVWEICFVCRAMVASARISVSAATSSFCPCRMANGRLMKWTSQISGFIIEIRRFSAGAVVRTTGPLKRTPSVFGRISVYWTMTRVKIRENSQIWLLPNNLSNCAPAMEAPNVCAAVLRIRITAIGFSISCLNLLQRRPINGDFSVIMAILLGVMLKRAASMTEHKNDTPSATAMLIIKVVI